jgi:tetratricopeptide (TPR) repeat protein
MIPDAEQLARTAMDAHRAGNYKAAEELSRSALETEPNFFKSLVHLSVLLRNRGEFQESADLAQRAIAIQPQAADGYVQLALALLGSGRPNDAIPFFHRAIGLSPNIAALHYHFGMALENVGRALDAKEAFLRASQLDPQDVRARISLGALLLTEENIGGARSCAEAALKLNPNSPEAHQLLAKVWVAEEKGPKAEECIRRSLQLDPNSSYGHFMLGFRLLQKGDFEGAEASCRRSIEIDPHQGMAYFGITQARKIVEADRPLIGQMLEVLRNTPLTLDQASYLHFGLGKAFDNLGEYESAMNHYEEAHQNAHLLRYREHPFDQSEYESDIDATIRLYNPQRLSPRGNGFESDLPIFVVGMMRSGTTLTEQILSSHPQVGAAGEQPFWAKRAHLAEDLSAETLDRLQAETLARDYCKELRRVSPGTSRVTDKLPGNYLRLGLIHLALPNAKIIHCRRNPVDTSLSIFFTANPVAPDFTHTKAGIAFVYRQYLKLMEHWRTVLPSDRFHEIQYEELVANPEPVIRGMLDFLGLEWDEACLRHDKNEKEVRTPSLWQVRQPMYSTSVEKWRRYEPWLGPLQDLLDLQSVAPL